MYTQLSFLTRRQLFRLNDRCTASTQYSDEYSHTLIIVLSFENFRNIRLYGEMLIVRLRKHGCLKIVVFFRRYFSSNTFPIYCLV